MKITDWDTSILFTSTFEIPCSTFIIPLSIAVVFLVGSVARADDAEPDPPPKTYAVVGATVFPVAKPMVRRGTVVWRDGKVLACGSEIEVPEGAEVIAGDGLYVTPGFVAVTASSVGADRGRGRFRRRLDPYDLNLRIALAHGITTAQLIDTPPRGGFSQDAPILQGAKSAIIKLTYADLPSMFVREPALNYLALPFRQVELNAFLLRERFRRAEEHLKKVAEAEATKAKPPKMARDLGHYVEILKKERPTVVVTSNRSQVEEMLELKEQYGFDLVLYEPNDTWTMASKLAARDVPVLVKSRGPDFDFFFGGEVFDDGDMIPVRRPGAFASGGALVGILPYRRTVMLSGLAGRDLTVLPLEAAFAVRGGMSEDDALKAITLNPAKILRIDDRVGSLEKGKDADLLILSGHPLDYRAHVLKAIINGKVYYDRSKSRLFEQVPVPKRKL